MKINTITEGRGLKIEITLNPFEERHTADVLTRPGWVQAVIENALENERKGRPRVMLRMTEEERDWMQNHGGYNRAMTWLIRKDRGDNVNICKKCEPGAGKYSTRVEIRDHYAADLLGRAANAQAYCMWLIKYEMALEKRAEEEGVI